jgi:hypothetical protein
LELWHLINPKLEETISKATVEQFLRDLAYIAIDMNISKSLTRINIHIDLLKMADDNDDHLKKKAIDYLDDANKHKEEFLKKILTGLNDQVTKQELITKIRDHFFKSYILRMGIAGKQMATLAVKEEDNAP